MRRVEGPFHVFFLHEPLRRCRRSFASWLTWPRVWDVLLLFFSSPIIITIEITLPLAKRVHPSLHIPFLCICHSLPDQGNPVPSSLRSVIPPQFFYCVSLTLSNGVRRFVPHSPTRTLFMRGRLREVLFSDPVIEQPSADRTLLSPARRARVLPPRSPRTPRLLTKLFTAFGLSLSAPAFNGLLSFDRSVELSSSHRRPSRRGSDSPTLFFSPPSRASRVLLWIRSIYFFVSSTVFAILLWFLTFKSLRILTYTPAPFFPSVSVCSRRTRDPG